MFCVHHLEKKSGISALKKRVSTCFISWSNFLHIALLLFLCMSLIYSDTIKTSNDFNSNPENSSDSDPDISDDDIFSLSDSESKDEYEHSPQFISELKAKFHDPNKSQQEKIQILTVLGTKWSVHKTAKLMNTSRYIIRKAREFTLRL
ncbi:uncharacterized protein LOC117177995 [Belonocnema kinseyi]|uniref:uncharacterized protein LOC117177995 n=1 Tax=Belonocnema kinseyi TaxID=2817044 RepID=UPI00143D3739|nr:uncharacterized protein LOC117177995 [Belonocnema kinseyi]